MSNLAMVLTASLALALACAALSVVVVLRRWAFAGEGIGHSGFGGAGCAWLLALAFPALDRPGVTYLAVIIFCLLTALAIARLTRRGRVSSDAVIGIFLVASLAFGFLAQHVYYQHRRAMPHGFDVLLFGQAGLLSPQFAAAAVACSLAVIVLLVALSKEILAYTFDPLTAQTSGVPADLVHDLLMLLLAIVIIVGARILGSVLVVALLVLPGAMAIALSRRLGAVIALATMAAVAGTVAGVVISARWPFIPTGPAVVLALFAQFLVAMLVHGRKLLGGSE
jgi:ABC-type Mn2+/Zn2+ transport system permease subunit